MLLSRSDYGKLLASKGERAVTVKRCETVEEVLRSADVVSLHCNLDDNTRHLMNAERLGMMKPDAVLVNAARGPCIDEAALVAHLKANPNFRAGAGAAGKSAARCCSAESGAERVAGQWGRAGRVGQSGSLGSTAESRMEESGGCLAGRRGRWEGPGSVQGCSARRWPRCCAPWAAPFAVAIRTPWLPCCLP